MTEELKRKFDREIKISYNLDFIKQCCKIASMYISGNYEVNDLDELILDLESIGYSKANISIEENVKELEELITQMALEYEKEIEVLRNE